MLVNVTHPDGTSTVENIGPLSQPRSVTPVRPLSASERLDMADRVAREHEASLRAAFLAHNGVDGTVFGGGMA